jgi:hypothetical protein
MIKVKWLPFGTATCLFGIIMYTRYDPIIINHEKIHRAQQIELLIVGAYIWYLVELIVYLLKYRKWSEAYLRVSFEKEAYHNQHNLDYLKSREFLEVINYV